MMVSSSQHAAHQPFNQVCKHGMRSCSKVWMPLFSVHVPILPPTKHAVEDSLLVGSVYLPARGKVIRQVIWSVSWLMELVWELSVSTVTSLLLASCSR